MEIIRKTTHAESDEFPIEVDVRLTGGQETEYVLDTLRKRPDRDLLLADLLDDCTAYLRRAMEVQEHFGSASAEQDWSYIWLSSIRTSISGHYRRALVTLITLAAACIDSASRTHPALARAQTDYWKTVEYPIFKRLVCFALTRPNLFTAAEAFDYLSANEFVLWHHSCRTELRELLVLTWPALTPGQAFSLTETVLKGPPRRLYRSDLSPEDIAEVSKDAIRERLATIRATGCPLPVQAAEFLREAELAEAPERVPSPEEESPIRDLTAPEIADALRNGFSPTGKYRQQWTDLASNDLPRAVDALGHLAGLGAWPTDLWSAALGQAVMLASSGGADHGVFPLLELVLAAPDNVVAENLHSVTLILHFLPNLKSPAADMLYWRLWDSAFGIARQRADGEPAVDSVEAALNVPVGRLTDELFYWAGTRAEDGDAEPFWIRLEKTCGAGSLGREARALAAIRTAWLFGSRPEWTRTTLLPCFDWKLSDEAKLVWKGFTFGATFSPSLWSALRDDFLATFDNLGQLDAEAVRVFHQLIGRIAIHEPAWLTDDEAQRIVTLAPHVGREQIAWVFWTSLDAAGEKAGSLWRDRIGPWISACWQPDEALKEPDTSMNLIRVSLAAGDAIPEAVDAVLPRMSPVDHPEGAIFLLAQSKAPEEFPLETVKLLDRAILRSRSFYKGDLEKLLRRIASAWAEAKHDSRFRNLSDFAAG